MDRPMRRVSVWRFVADRVTARRALRSRYPPNELAVDMVTAPSTYTRIRARFGQLAPGVPGCRISQPGRGALKALYEGGELQYCIRGRFARGVLKLVRGGAQRIDDPTERRR